MLWKAGRPFSERDHQNTSREDVAKTFGISMGTLYTYVSDKQEIFGLYPLARFMTVAGRYGISIVIRILP